MRRALLAVLATLPLATGAPSAWAAPPISAADFAAQCSAGPFLVSSNLTVEGGTGGLTGDCAITLANKVTLRFRDATITGPHALVVRDSLEWSRIVVHRATIDVGGELRLSAGCCTGGAPGHSEVHGSVNVKRSRLQGASVEISGSPADDHGSVSIKRSYVEATGGSGLRIRASSPGSSGVVGIHHSDLFSGTGILIDTDVAGQTSVKTSTLTFVTGIIITTGPGGTCTSTGNTPTVPCS